MYGSEEYSETVDHEEEESIMNVSSLRVTHKKKLDIAFLFSDPLVRFVNGALQEFPHTIDTEGEFYRLMRHLEKSQLNKQITVKRQAANFMTLR